MMPRASSITLTQLQKSIDMQQQRGAGAESMDVEDKTDPPQDEDCVLLRGGPRRTTRPSCMRTMNECVMCLLGSAW